MARQSRTISSRRFSWWESFKGPAVILLLFGTSVAATELAHLPSLEVIPAPTVESWSPIPNFKHVISRPPVNWRLERIALYVNWMGVSVAVGDLNGDGWQDLFLNDLGGAPEGYLFLNDGKGGMRAVENAVRLLPGIHADPVFRPIIADLDEDGHRDLLLLAYCPRIAWNRGDGILIESEAQPIGCGYIATGMNLADVSGDESLELILAPYTTTNYYGDLADSKVMPSSFSAAKNGAPVSVFEYAGNRKFRLLSKTPFPHLGWTHAVGSWIGGGQKRPLVWFATDYGMDKVYVERSGNYREIAAGFIEQSASRNGMGIEIADVDGDGRPLFFVSQIFAGRQKVAGNYLWKWNGGEEFVDVAEDRGVKRCGFAWGAKFFDLENDGDLDLFVGNGGFWQPGANRSYWYFLSVMDAADGSILQDANAWPAVGKSHLDGEQASCLFTNEKGSFAEVGGAVPAIQKNLANERGVAVADFANDGRLSTVAVSYERPPEFLRWSGPQGAWIGFDLSQEGKNPEAYGASVTLTVQGKKISHQKQPLNGYSAQSDGRLHFGLGSLANAAEIEAEVIWPDGSKESIKKFKVGSYHQIRRSR